MKRPVSHHRLLPLFFLFVIPLLTLLVPVLAASDGDANLTFQTALALRAQEKYVDAIATWQRVPALALSDPNLIARSQLEIGITYEMMGEHEQALSTLQAAIVLLAGSPQKAAGARLMRARIFEDRKDYDEAATEYRPVADFTNEYTAEGKLGLGRCLALLGRDDDALAGLAAVETCTDDASTRMLAATEIAKIKFKRGEEPAGLAGLQEACFKYPEAALEMAEAVFLMAERYRLKGREDDALSVLMTLQREYAGYNRIVPRAMIASGDINRQLGHFDEALVHYAAVMKFHPKVLEQVAIAEERIASLLAAATVTDESKAYLDRARGVYAQTQAVFDARASINEALAKVEQGDQAAAKEILDGSRTSKTVTKDANLMADLGLAQVRAGDIAAAQTTLESALELAAQQLKPDKYVLYRVEFPFFLRNYPAVVAEGEAALETYADGTFGIELRHFLAQSYEQVGQMDKSLQMFGSIAARYSSVKDSSTRQFVASALLKSGYMLLARDRKTEAAEKFRIVVDKFADTPQFSFAADRLRSLAGGQ